MNIKAIVEIPKGSKNKYEIKNGVLTLDRIIDIKYPYNYGFIPNTLWHDGDALDVFIVGPRIHPGTEVEIELLGVIKMLDAGESDYKLVAKVKGYRIKYIDSYFDYIEEFLNDYKRCVKIKEVSLDNEEASKVLKQSQKYYKNGL